MELWANNDLSLEQKLKIENRIACPEAGYPASEALYLSVEEFDEEQFAGGSFVDRLIALKAAGEGSY